MNVVLVYLYGVHTDLAKKYLLLFLESNLYTKVWQGNCERGRSSRKRSINQSLSCSTRRYVCSSCYCERAVSVEGENVMAMTAMTKWSDEEEDEMSSSKQMHFSQLLISM